MDIRAKLEKQISKKRDEIEDLTSKKSDISMQIREAEAFIRGLEESLKHIPELTPTEKTKRAQAKVKPGSDIDRAMKALRKIGKPAHVDEILVAAGEESDKKSRHRMGGQLNYNARNKRIFKKTAPNTFGLIEWNGVVESDDGGQIELPDDFGRH